MSKVQNQIIINNEDDLQDYFHSIHSFIRNKFGLYGKAALQFFNFFFVLKVIEPFIETLFDDDTCLYSNILKLTNENDKIDLIRTIQRKIYQSEHKNTFFMSFTIDKFDSKNETLTQFLKKLNILTPEIMNQYHVYGRVYEYFLGHVTGRNPGSRAGSQMEDLGQFFTSRHLVRYCIAKVDPSLKDGDVPKMGDFYCGSGGFITEYIRYLNHKYNDILWEDNTNKLFGFDTDPEILKSARVDVMTLTKTFTNSNVYIENFQNINSFENDFNIKVDFNFTNPPYGNSGKTSDDDKLKLINAGKEIKYIASNGSINNIKAPVGTKKTKSKPFLINGDNKETLAILHGMGILEKDGVYCGVLKEGCFFDKKFQDLRTNLCKYYEVEYIISIPQDDFLNTSTKTSILIFKNSGKQTENIRFCELEIINKDNKIDSFNEINSQTKQIINNFTPINYKFSKKDGDYLTINYAELEKNNFSFNFKNYIKEDIKINEGFKVVKLGDIIKWKPKMKHAASEGLDKGLYKFYTSSDKIKYCNFLDVNDELCLIIGNGGKGCIFLDSVFSASDHMFILQGDNNDITTYIYYYLKYDWDNLLKKCFNGSTLGNISKETLNNYEIPIPEDIETIKIYLDYLGPANECLQTLQTLQTQKERSICGKIKLLTMMGKRDIDYDEFKLIDLINMKDGKFNSKDMIENGKYPFYNASVNNPAGTINDYCFDGDKYILFVKSGGNSNNKISDSHALGLPMLVKNKCSSNVHVSQIIIKQNILTYDYLFYYLLMLKPKIQENAKYSTGLGGVDMDYFRSRIIRILKPEIIKKYKLDEDFDFMDKLRNDIQNTLKLQEETTKEMMKLVLNSTEEKEIIPETETEIKIDTVSKVKTSKIKVKEESDTETEAEILTKSKVKSTKTKSTKKVSKSNVISV
jgi:hypothetical protein